MLAQEKSRLKERVSEGELTAVFDELTVYLAASSPLLLNDLLVLEGRYNRLQKDQTAGVVDYETAQRILNDLSRELLYFIDQIPDTSAGNGTVKPKRKNGKVLHDIPERLPLQKLTKCLVRIAETEELVLKDFSTGSTTVIEDIPIAKDMSVELFELGSGGNFEIQTVNSAAQSVDAYETTQWLFYVRPLVEGEHLLFLKISVIQQVDGKELVKETVLEREVNVTAEIPAVAAQREWAETQVLIAPPQNLISAPTAELSDAGAVGSKLDKKSSSSPLEDLGGEEEKPKTRPIPPPSPGQTTSAGPVAAAPARSGKKKRGLLLQLFLIGGFSLAMAAGSYMAYNYITEPPGHTIRPPNVGPGEDPVIDPVIPIDSNVQVDLDVIPAVGEVIDEVVPSVGVPVDKTVQHLEEAVDTLTAALPADSEIKDQIDKLEEQTESILDKAKDVIVPAATSENTAYRIFSKVVRKTSVPYGQPLMIEVETKGFDPKRLRFILNDSNVLRPARQEGTRLFFQIRSSRNAQKLVIEDGISGTSRTQEISGGHQSTVFLRKLDL